MTVVFLNPTPSVNSGFDSEAQYQMVPVGGVRSLALFVMPDETEDVIVQVAQPPRISMFGFFTVQGSTSFQGGNLVMKPNSAVRFFVSATNPGPTTIDVTTVSGRPRAFLLVSVKPELQVTYQLAVLSDPIHVVKDKAKVGATLQANMLGAERLWLQQANIRLTRVGPINDVVAPVDLGDRIVADDPKIIDIIAKATLTPQQVPAHLFIYATWDLIYSTGLNPGGSTQFNMCLIETAFSGRVGELLTAHEVGHALELLRGFGVSLHEDNTNMLMTSGGINNDLLSMRNIEFTNPL